MNKKKRNLQVVLEVTFILQGRWSTGNKDVFVNIKKNSQLSYQSVHNSFYWTLLYTLNMDILVSCFPNPPPGNFGI